MRLLMMLMFSLGAFFAGGQTRTISGKVLDESDLTPLPGVRIQTMNTLLLATTDLNGNFKVEVPATTGEFLLIALGMEWTSIRIPDNCNNAEVIMMNGGVYDFMTVAQENKKRYKRFKELKNKHHQAFEKGVFTSGETCVTYIFRKYKR